eukprot:TRINITY_DN62329_c0_g1_i1.p1 TRINITY_DN62329_c0_g1~~TRINITY_DN62329_c0_g1_i1.p1  ORF type:complete len:212 (+),score=53.20 TRINITY_DN62329_c0_g1_i1:76-636(+)
MPPKDKDKSPEAAPAEPPEAPKPDFTLPWHTADKLFECLAGMSDSEITSALNKVTPARVATVPEDLMRGVFERVDESTWKRYKAVLAHLQKDERRKQHARQLAPGVAAMTLQQLEVAGELCTPQMRDAAYKDLRMDKSGCGTTLPSDINRVLKDPQRDAIARGNAINKNPVRIPGSPAGSIRGGRN